jgi:hypothetical protein
MCTAGGASCAATNQICCKPIYAAPSVRGVCGSGECEAGTGQCVVTPSPTNPATDSPSVAPTRTPSSQTTPRPSASPSQVSTDEPTFDPTSAPTSAPTSSPTTMPTNAENVAAPAAGDDALMLQVGVGGGVLVCVIAAWLVRYRRQKTRQPLMQTVVGGSHNTSFGAPPPEALSSSFSGSIWSGVSNVVMSIGRPSNASTSPPGSVVEGRSVFKGSFVENPLAETTNSSSGSSGSTASDALQPEPLAQFDLTPRPEAEGRQTSSIGVSWRESQEQSRDSFIDV